MLDIQNKEEDVFITSIKNFIDTLVSLLNIALRHKIKLILNFILSGILIVTVIYFVLPKNYITKMSFIAPEPQVITSYSSDISDILKEKGLDLFSKPNFLVSDPNDFWLEVLKSRTMQEYISNKLNLKDKLKSMYIEDTFEYLDKITSFKSEKGLIKIEIKTKEKKEGEEIAKLYLGKLSLILNSVKKSENKNQIEFLDKRIKKVHNNLLLASKNIVKFQTEKNFFSLEKQGSEVISTITKIQAEIISLEAQLSALTQTYTEKSTKVKSLRANIESLKEKLDQLKGKNINKDIIDLNIKEIPSASIDYLEISRDVKLLEQILQTLTKEYEILKIKEAKGGLSLKIIDEPKASERKYGVNKKLASILGLLLLLSVNFIFVFIIFIKEKLKENAPDTYKKITEIKLF
ncbi:MAG: hypothetical protein U0457_16995 [Candidatus Sericytochromatia bacterium]